MGYGDQLIATGLARGAAQRGKRVAFGDGKQIIWDHLSEQMFKGNPNIAHPGSERDSDLHWIPYYRGSRLYNADGGNRWIWNMSWRCTPGEVFLTQQELELAKRVGEGYVVIEPNVQHFKSPTINKNWGPENYWRVARKLIRAGADVRQLRYPAHGAFMLPDIPHVKTNTFREAVAVLSRAALYIGPEGGMHHAAAAVGIPAVVIFGGFIPPSVTGYQSHVNLTGGATHFCGSFTSCIHCRKALQNIKIDDVLAPAQEFLCFTS